MTLLRFILIVLLGWVIWRFIQRWHRNTLIAKQEKESNTVTKQLGPMVRCNHCNLFFPKQEAIEIGNVYYCCKEHIDNS